VTTPDTVAPVAESRRIDSMDVVRGFALLGILVMNIQLFTMPDGRVSTRPRMAS